MINLNYAARKIDHRLNNLSDYIDKFFSVSTKSFFVLLLSYGLENNINPNSVVIEFNNGKSFRSDTDPKPDSALYVLIIKYLNNTGQIDKIDEILEDRSKFEKIMDELTRIASASGLYLLETELSSYKGIITNAKKAEFMADVLNALFVPLEKKELF